MVKFTVLPYLKSELAPSGKSQWPYKEMKASALALIDRMDSKKQTLSEWNEGLSDFRGGMRIPREGLLRWNAKGYEIDSRPICFQ